MAQGSEGGVLLSRTPRLKWLRKDWPHWNTDRPEAMWSVHTNYVESRSLGEDRYATESV